MNPSRLRPGARQFLAIDYCVPELEQAKLLILPIPYQRTTSYGKGAGHGPSAILKASSYLELYDEEADRVPSGWLTLPPLRFERLSTERSMECIRKAAGEVVSTGRKLLSLGGEHTVTGPLVEAHRTYPDLTVLQLDAHADLRNSYEGSKLSHACVMRRVVASVPAVQIGIRSMSEDEAKASLNLPTRIFFAHQIAADPHWMQRALACLSRNVYLTVDVDVFDPSVMPSTGTPEPGGLYWYSVLNFLRLVASKRNFVGADIVELAPIKGLHGPDFTTAKLAYKIIQLLLK